MVSLPKGQWTTTGGDAHDHFENIPDLQREHLSTRGVGSTLSLADSSARSLRFILHHVAKFFATCARGLESVLARELGDLRASKVDAGRGGVAFQGDLTLLYRANLHLRTAIRVLRPILEATVATPEELYEAVQTIDW